MRKLLVVTLVVLTAFPIVIFSLDVLGASPTRAAQEALRTGRRLEDPATRRERVRAARERIHPSMASIALGMLFELFWVAVAAVVGRRIFNLRL